MKSINKFLNNEQSLSENILMSLFFIFIIFDIHVPDELAPLFASVPGMAIILLSVLYLFKVSNGVMGVLALVVAYELIHRSGGSLSPTNTTMPFLQQSEARKKQYMDSVNVGHTLKTAPVSLEEGLINNMVPLVNSTEPYGISFKPVLAPSSGATKF